MKFYTLTRTTNVYSDDVMVVNFLDTGDGIGKKEADDTFEDIVSWGCVDGDETTVDMWVFDPSSTEEDKTTHVKSATISDFDGDDE